MRRVSFRDLALALTKVEKGQREVDIAQMNEVLARTLELLDALPLCDVRRLIADAAKRKARRRK